MRKPYPDIDGFRPGEGFEWYANQGILEKLVACVQDGLNVAISTIQEPTIQKILSEIPIYSENTRNENIERINIQQYIDLDNLESEPYFQIPQALLEHTDNRRLVLYYRGSQTSIRSAQQIRGLMRFIRTYIEGGYSSVFDTVSVVYRLSGLETIRSFCDISHYANGDRFRALSSIYGNTVHFTDGTPDVVPGTIPIISKAVGNRWRETFEWNETSRDILENSLEFPLEYDGDGHIKHGRARNNPNYEKQCRIFLKTIQECEKRMLKYGGCIEPEETSNSSA